MSLSTNGLAPDVALDIVTLMPLDRTSRSQLYRIHRRRNPRRHQRMFERAAKSGILNVDRI